MAYIVTFKGHIVAGPFLTQGDAVQASIRKAQELHFVYPASEFKVEKV